MITSININSVYKILLALILICVNITGLIQLVAGGAAAEGSVIFFTVLLMGILLINKNEYDMLDFMFIFVAIYSVIITILAITFLGIEKSAIIGLYYYIVPCLIFLNRKHVFFKKNVDFYFLLFLSFVILNSIWAIYQTINPNAIYPVQECTLRVRGLMKSTLNYSGLLGACFYPLLFYKLKNKINKLISTIILLIGGFLTISKGFFINIIIGFIASYPIQILSNCCISKRQLRNLIKSIFVALIILLVFIIIVIKTGAIAKYGQFINIVNFKTNASNVERLNSWTQFFTYFYNNPFGYGVGQIGSGTSFVDRTVNFESYILDTLYSIGIVGFVYFMIPIIYVFNLRNKLIPKYFQLYLMFFIGISIQNLVQVSMLTPATAVISYFNLIFLANYFYNQSHKDSENKGFI